MAESKKKLVVVKSTEAQKGSTNRYSISGFHYAWVNSPDSKAGRRQSAGACTCREELAAQVFHFVNGRERGDFDSETEIDLNRLRLLIVTSPGKDPKYFKERLFAGKNLLNIYEKLGKWQHKSVITTVNHEFYEKDNAWLITGPKEWMVAGQMISMLGLILRVAARSDNGPIEAGSLKELEEIWKKRSVGEKSGDWGHIKKCWKSMRVLAKYNSEIFGIDPKKNFCSLRTDRGEVSYGINSGIASLNNGLSYQKEIQTKFEKFMKKEWEK